MKKRTLARIGMLALALCLVSTCLLGGTLAKYTTVITGTGTGAVAKFDVKATLDDAATGLATGNINIFDTAYTNVTTNKLAPGTEGDFTYMLHNDSEVAVNYTVDYTVDEDGVYLLWSTDGTMWTDDLADISTPVVLAIGAADTSITLQWKWAYEADALAVGQSDAADTALGVAASAAPSITIAVTFTQVVPA